jgi:hypothetical protein
MNKFLLSILLILIINISNAQVCQIPNLLNKEIIEASNNEKFVEDDFYRINTLLFEYEAIDSLINLNKCTSYSKNIEQLFNSETKEKRALAYRLISVANDSTFNNELINRINSKESSLLKTWSTTALMANNCGKASDDLFVLFSSFPEGLPVDILINMYIQYDTNAVKKTCWKFIDSESKNHQILAIQCLANFEKDYKLQSKLIEFLNSWDDNSKGWVISSISMQKMENLKPILEKYSEVEILKEVIIRALENSPTKTDNKFAKQLDKRKN